MKNKSKKKIPMTYYQNPFYNDVFGTQHVVIPTKRAGYKQDPVTKKVTISDLPKGTKEFEKYIRESFSCEDKEEWPYSDRLLVSIWISIKNSEYKCKDIDNIAKSIMDALKGIVYVDDKQIDTLHISKMPSENNFLMIGIKKLKKNDYTPYSPPLYSPKPFS